MLNIPPNNRSRFFFKPSIHILVVILLGLLVYSNTFKSEFTFDDWWNFLQSVLTKDLRYFLQSSLVDNSNLDLITRVQFKTRIVGYFTFFLNYAVNGNNVFGYHAVNISIHLLSALSVYWLLSLLLKTPYFTAQHGSEDQQRTLIPFLAAILFVCHPIETQAVTYVVQRFASQATLFYLFTIALYIKSRLAEDRRTNMCFYGFSVIVSLLAMRTKEISLTLPIMLTVCEHMFFEKITKKRILVLLPYYLTALTVPLTLIASSGSFSNWGSLTNASGLYNPSVTPRWHYFITQLRVIVTYIRLLFLPVNQNLDYQYPLYTSFIEPAVFLSFLFLSSICGLAVYLYKRSHNTSSYLRLVSFGIIWFFIALSIESSIIPIDDLIFEHRLYLPSAGYFIFIASLIQTAANARPRYIPAILTACVAAVLALSTATYLRNDLWKDGIAIWEDVIKKSPGKARGYTNAGAAYFYSDPDKALAYHLKAFEIDPAFQFNTINIGTLYFHKKDYAAAMRYYKLAVNADSPVSNYNIAGAVQNIGYMAFLNKDLQEAKKYFSALTKTPFREYRSMGIYDLALTQEHLKDYREAIHNYERFLETPAPETNHFIPKAKEKLTRLRGKVQ